jgi:hypothetical protein
MSFLPDPQSQKAFLGQLFDRREADKETFLALSS